MRRGVLGAPPRYCSPSRIASRRARAHRDRRPPGRRSPSGDRSLWRAGPGCPTPHRRQHEELAPTRAGAWRVWRSNPGAPSSGATPCPGYGSTDPRRSRTPSYPTRSGHDPPRAPWVWQDPKFQRFPRQSERSRSRRPFSPAHPVPYEEARRITRPNSLALHTGACSTPPIAGPRMLLTRAWKSHHWTERRAAPGSRDGAANARRKTDIARCRQRSARPFAWLDVADDLGHPFEVRFTPCCRA